MTGQDSETASTTPIEIPDATTEPAAYVEALLDTLADRDPLEVYETTADAVTKLCADLSPRHWAVPLADGEWTAAQVVGHLFDVDIVYGFRLRLVLTEDDPAYPGYDEDRWSRLPRPEPTALVAAFRRLRDVNAALLRDTPRTQWQRTGRHGEQGSERFALMVAKLAGHDLAHLNQLARTVEVATREANTDA